MGIHVNIGEAKTRLSELVAASLRGEEVILSKAGKPVARLVGLEEAIVLTKEAERAERRAKWEAYIGSKKHLIDPDIDWFAPTFTDEELDSFGILPDKASDG